MARDTGEAVRWLREAAGQGHAAAQYRLGAMYFNDEQAPVDKAEAARWFRAAAEQGHASAQERLREYRETYGPAGNLPDGGSAETGTVSVADSFASQVRICATPDPALPSSAFNLAKSAPGEDGDYHVNYSCKQACADWRDCLVPAYKDDGMQLLTQGRNPDQPKLALAYVVDDMAGHLALTPDGGKTVLLHSGAGGTDYRYAEPALDLERRLSVRTVMVRWEKGFTAAEFEPPFRAPINWGWYSRTGDKASNVFELNKRVAAIIAWVHENLAGNEAFATAGCSMGSNATFLARLWHGLDPIIDYQLFVGGPNNWDFNAHCSRREYTQGIVTQTGPALVPPTASVPRLLQEASAECPGPMPTLASTMKSLRTTSIKRMPVIIRWEKDWNPTLLSMAAAWLFEQRPIGSWTIK